MKKLADCLGEPTEIRMNGERHYPCPKCGGTDRFLLWPEGERGYCRQCNWQPDVIQYLREIEGMRYPEAAREVGKALEEISPVQQRREKELGSKFAVWREHQFTRAYQALVDARARLNAAQYAQSCYHIAPSTFTAEELAYWAGELIDAEGEFQSAQEALLLMSPDGNRDAAFALWIETGAGK